MSAVASFEELREAALDDERIVGVVVHGSRGKGAFVSPSSDFDVSLVVNGDTDPVRQRFPLRRGDPVEVVVYSLEEFRAYALPGSETEWNRYAFTHVKVEIDKLCGLVQQLVDEKGSLSADEAEGLAPAALDAYINSYYRSAKNLERGLALEAQLDAAESIPSLLSALFALNGRVRPFNKYLAWELEHFPLEGDEWTADTLLPRLRTILETGDLAEQQALFRSTEALARRHGLGGVVDDWEPDVAWLRGPH